MMWFVAAVALSPATDGTFTSPSMRDNVATDHMLVPQFGTLNRIRLFSRRMAQPQTERRPHDS